MVALNRVVTAAQEWTQWGWDASHPPPFLWGSAGDPYSDLAPNVGLARVPSQSAHIWIYGQGAAFLSSEVTLLD